MKVKTWIQHEEEIEVEISWEDVYSSFLSSDIENPEKRMLSLINSAFSMFKNLPDDFIKTLNKEQKKTIYEAMKKEIERFNPEIKKELGVE